MSLPCFWVTPIYKGIQNMYIEKMLKAIKLLSQLRFAMHESKSVLKPL